MSDEMRHWVDERLEAYVDGDLTDDERRRIDAYVRDDGAAAAQLRAARLVERALLDVERPACPPDVTREVLAQARREAARSIAEPSIAIRRAAADRPSMRATLRRGLARRDAIHSRLDALWTTVLKPSIAMGVLVAVVVVGALVGRIPPETDQTVGGGQEMAATTQEVEQALQDAKWALAFISEVSRETGRTIRREVIRDRVAEPIHNAVGAALQAEPNS